MPEMRPYSWHPSSGDTSLNPETLASGETPTGNVISGFENLAVEGPSSTSSTSIEQSIQDAFSLGYGYSCGLPTTTIDEPSCPPVFDSSAGMGFAAMLPYDYANGARNDDGHMLQLDLPVQPGTPSVYEASQFQGCIGNSRSTMNTNAQHHGQFPENPAEDGDELIGIGLYDDGEEHAQESMVIHSLNAQVSHHVGGKDLKLEETWEPPKTIEDEESSEEAEEIYESPVVECSTQHVQPALYDSRVDLSGQSFFLNEDDDVYGQGEQHNDYMTYMNGCANPEQWKLQPVGLRDFAFF